MKQTFSGSIFITLPGTVPMPTLSVPRLLASWTLDVNGNILVIKCEPVAIPQSFVLCDLQKACSADVYDPYRYDVVQSS